MDLFLSLKTYDIKKFQAEMNTLNSAIKETKVINNQPHDKDNYEALYYYICILFSNQVSKNEKNIEKYFKNLKLLISKFNELKKYYENVQDNITFKEEDKDFKKFMVIVLAIINLDYSNYEEISHIACIFNIPNDIKRNSLINFFKMQILDRYDEIETNDFINKISKENNFHSLSYEYIDEQLRLSEECYLYEYIIKNNIYEKYKDKIINLLNIIFKSDLFKQIFKLIYNQDDKTYELIFENENNINYFWENVLIFVPFKLKRIPGFFYREIPHIFISIYKIRHFNKDLENELYTLGAFIRTLTYKSLGHYILSCIFFMFYANTLDAEKYNSPRMSDKINELNKGSYFELVGEKLEKIEKEIINENEKLINLLMSEGNQNQLEEKYKELENKLNSYLERIIGNEYSKKLCEKIILKGKDIYDTKIKIYESKEIIDILFQYIYDDFNNIILSLEKKEELYKNDESGNMVEFLLYNDFSQNMTLKQCLFLLNEENYKETNLFKFRSAFKDIPNQKNADFLKELTKGNKIFKELFTKYNTLYENDNIAKNDFIAQKTFKGSCGKNFNTMFPAFQCFIFKTLGYNPPEYSISD